MLQACLRGASCLCAHARLHSTCTSLTDVLGNWSFSGPNWDKKYSPDEIYSPFYATQIIFWNENDKLWHNK